MLGRKRTTNRPAFEALCQNYRMSYGLDIGVSIPPWPGWPEDVEQGKAWNSLYHYQRRLGRMEAGLCDNCQQPAMPGVRFCAPHRAANSARAGKHNASHKDRKRLFSKQHGMCPICMTAIGLWDSIDHDHTTGKKRGILHQRCNLKVAAIDGLDAVQLRRIRRYVAS